MKLIKEPFENLAHEQGYESGAELMDELGLNRKSYELSRHIRLRSAAVVYPIFELALFQRVSLLIFAHFKTAPRLLYTYPARFP